MALNMLYNPATGKMIVSNTKNLYTVDSRIKIATYEDLIKIGVDDDYPIDANYLQIADITQPSTLASHVPIALKGTYDGGFFELKDFVITGQTGRLGVFSLVSSTTTTYTSKTALSNIIVNNMSITVDSNSSYAGCIAGVLSSYSEAENCLVINSSITGDIPFSVYGGIFGYCYSNIKNMQVSNTTIYNALQTYASVGGVVGKLQTNDSQISNCISTNNILTTYDTIYRITCGIVAEIYNPTHNAVTSCFSATSIINRYDTNDFAIAQDDLQLFENNFYDNEVYEAYSSRLEYEGGTGLTTLESKLVSSYPTWDISYKASDLDTKFRIDISGTINDGYPYLTQFETALINGGV